MKLDSVTTIAIGRNDSNNNELTDLVWSSMKQAAYGMAEETGTVVAAGEVKGITSDQDQETAEDSYIVLVINADLVELRLQISWLLRVCLCTSACFSTDTEHEPVFATSDGFRPPIPAPAPVTAAAYAPAHGGYPSV